MFRIRWPPLPGLCTLGVAAFPQHGDTAEAVFRAADAALYRAKAAGRNCVVVAQAASE